VSGALRRSRAHRFDELLREKKQGKPLCSPSRGPWIGGTTIGDAVVAGLTGSSPYVQPFGSPAATRDRHFDRPAKARGFAPPAFADFALSRMKGVVIQARRRGLPPKVATKTGHPVCFTKPRTFSRSGQMEYGKSHQAQVKVRHPASVAGAALSHGVLLTLAHESGKHLRVQDRLPSENFRNHEDFGVCRA
jgi:hypothetical protein